MSTLFAVVAAHARCAADKVQCVIHVRTCSAARRSLLGIAPWTSISPCVLLYCTVGRENEKIKDLPQLHCCCHKVARSRTQIVETDVRPASRPGKLQRLPAHLGVPRQDMSIGHGQCCITAPRQTNYHSAARMCAEVSYTVLYRLGHQRRRMQARGP